MVFGDGEEIKIGNKTFIVHKAPATAAYDFGIRYKLALEKQDADSTRDYGIRCGIKISWGYGKKRLWNFARLLIRIIKIL